MTGGTAPRSAEIKPQISYQVQRGQGLHAARELLYPALFIFTVYGPIKDCIELDNSKREIGSPRKYVECEMHKEYKPADRELTESQDLGPERESEEYEAPDVVGLKMPCKRQLLIFPAKVVGTALLRRRPHIVIETDVEDETT